MVSKDDLWPKYFNTPEATVDDIELFFVPSEARHQDKFDSMLQDMIGGEHALRALTPYGELLVFTSTELPLRHWRYQLKCYLWGIFKETQGSSSSILVPNRNRTPDNILAARYAVNDRAPTEDDAQVVTDELGRGKRIRKIIARFDDYDCSRD
uniref:AIPP2-like SPOC-like domain-containing protein n=1 Tax=Solanum tuberosum TaxID=4113 RepID=M1DRL8_SOLTU